MLPFTSICSDPKHLYLKQWAKECTQNTRKNILSYLLDVLYPISYESAHLSSIPEGDGEEEKEDQEAANCNGAKEGSSTLNRDEKKCSSESCSKEPQLPLVNEDASEAGTHTGRGAASLKARRLSSISNGNRVGEEGSNARAVHANPNLTSGGGDVTSETVPVHPDPDSLFNQQECKDEAVLALEPLHHKASPDSSDPLPSSTALQANSRSDRKDCSKVEDSSRHDADVTMTDLSEVPGSSLSVKEEVGSRDASMTLSLESSLSEMEFPDDIGVQEMSVFAVGDAEKATVVTEGQQHATAGNNELPVSADTLQINNGSNTPVGLKTAPSDSVHATNALENTTGTDNSTIIDIPTETDSHQEASTTTPTVSTTAVDASQLVKSPEPKAVAPATCTTTCSAVNNTPEKKSWMSECVSLGRFAEAFMKGDSTNWYQRMLLLDHVETVQDKVVEWLDQVEKELKGT